MKIKFFILLIFLFISCTCTGNNKLLNLQSVQREFPDSRIEILEENWTYLVKTQDGKIWLAETSNSTNNKITYKRELFQ
jgi:hypothetical protein